MTSTLDSNRVAQFLADTPNFFEEHAGLLGQVQLASVHTGRAISLQERQMEIMREKYKALELRLADLMRLGQENDALAHKFQSWTQVLLMARNDVDLPHVLISGLRTIFDMPHATLRLWGVAPDFMHAWFAQEVPEDARIFARSLTVPYCGANNDFETVRLLEDADLVQSAAILPLRVGIDAPAFGLLILGSPDAQRFTEDMATDFLSNIGLTASAALSCLLD